MNRSENSPNSVSWEKTAGRISSRRIWVFRGLALAIPLGCLLFLELALRVGGYGYSTSFFQETKIRGQQMMVENQNFSLRFFPPELARGPTAFAFARNKAPDVCRIFIFGESAAMGDPQPAFGPGRYMEVLLKERFPEKKFEIINTGITAINSHVILPIARDCAAQHGDIWIIYVGNNEMVGPFGAATRAPPRSAVRFILALQTTRVGQLFTALTRRLGAKPGLTSSHAAEMFLRNQVRPGDARKQTVYNNYKENLRGIVKLGIDSGAKVIINTMCVNLKDCPPFSSLHKAQLSEQDRAEFQKLSSEAISLQTQGSFAEAMKSFQQADRIDSSFAELHFKEGTCLLQGSNSVARSHFQQACDDDALPFRADSRINSIIRNLAQTFAGRGLVLCDAEQAMNNRSAQQIAGSETFFEHVHFQFDGSYALGRQWAERVEQLISTNRPQPMSAWARQDTCNRRLGLSLWNRASVLDTIIKRLRQPPFNGQSNNSNSIAMLEAETADLRLQESRPNQVEKTRDEFKYEINQSPADHLLRESYATFLEATGNPEAAMTQYSEAIRLNPRDGLSHLNLGSLLLKQNRLDEALAQIEKALEIMPYNAQARQYRDKALGKSETRLQKSERTPNGK